MENGQDAWQSIIGLSREMLTQAKSGKWDRVSDLEAERIGLLRQYFSGNRSLEQLERVRPLADQLLAMDKEVADLCRKAQDGLVGDLKSLRRGRAAAKAYRG